MILTSLSAECHDQAANHKPRITATAFAYDYDAVEHRETVKQRVK